MRKITDSLVFKFALIMAFFAFITLSLAGFITYINQTKVYKKQCCQEIQKLGIYLKELILNQGEDFVNYQKCYFEFYNEANIPFDFTDTKDAEENWLKIFSEEYPGKVYGLDVKYEDLSDRAKIAWLEKNHEYWLLTFESARAAFNIPYSYYIVPKEGIFNLVYMIDGERTVKEINGKNYLYLGDEYYNDPVIYKVEWDTWFTGEEQYKFQTWNNAWGHTYAYYVPLIIDGQKLGIIGTEIEVASVNQKILTSTNIQMLILGIVISLSLLIMLIFIHKNYIKQIVFLDECVTNYSASKDSRIASKIEWNISGRNEITELSYKISEMILEMENYIKNLFSTQQELDTAKKHAQELNDLAVRDALTGIRNKTAYDKEIKILEDRFKNGLTEFGFAMVDLNNLKIINDTYGHEQGNVALKKLCGIVCRVFCHSPVFRIGGDEFIVILLNDDYKNIETLEVNFYDSLIQSDIKLEPWENVSAALGWACYDKSKDSSLVDVLKRADKNMYDRKSEMKAIRNSR